MSLFLVAVFILLILVAPRSVTAVPPPDFLFAIGSQVAWVFAFCALLLFAAAGIFLQFFRAVWVRFKHWKFLLVLVVAVILIISVVAAVFYDKYRQQVAYQNWVTQSAEQATVESVIPTIKEEEKIESGNFFLENQSLPTSISNEEFEKMTNAPNFYVLDAREDEEFAIGYFPGSTHIRFADLLAGEWSNLPTDRVIYVFCWSGMRGEEVANFLRSKNILARFVEKGADGWVKFGGTWQGGIAFSSKYSEERYKKTLTLDEFLSAIKNGTVIVDSRPVTSYNAWHIPNSINIPIIYTPTSELEAVLSLVPSEASVITVCDDFISCFDAKITGVKLEAKGHIFFGRYVQPWEYRNAFPE